MTLISKDVAQLFDGEFSTEEDLLLLKARLPANLIPEWLVALLKENRLAYTCFSLSEDKDVSSVGADVRWLAPSQIITEAFEGEPGLSVTPMGFVPIADCAIGSGDPYFLDLRVATEDPPLVRVLHDFVREGKSFPLEGIEIVSAQLSDFFAKATVD